MCDFMRRLRKEDPAVAIYQAYAEEGVGARRPCESPGVPESEHGPQLKGPSRAESALTTPGPKDGFETLSNGLHA